MKNGPLRTLLKLYRGNERNLIISTLYYIIKSSPVWIIPIVSSAMINIAANSGERSLSELWPYVAIAVISLAQNIPLHTVYESYISRSIRSVEAYLRTSLVEKLQRLSMSYHKNMKRGKIQSKVLRDVEQVELLSRQILIAFVPAVLNTLIMLFIIISKSMVVALFFLFTIPIAVVIIRFFRRTIRIRNKEFRQQLEEMSARISEMVEMIPVTRAHALEDVELERMKVQLEKVRESGYRLDMAQALFGSSSWVSFHFFQTACLVFSIILAYKKIITVGDVTLYQGFFSSILSSINGIINVYPNIARGFESVNSITELLSADDVEDYSGKKEVKSVEGEIVFENVSFRYPDSDEWVLKDFSLHVRKGECIAIVGESGAGKSTLLNLIIGFDKPVKGKIYLDGEDFSNIDMRSYRKHLAVVTQDNILFSGSILENITYGLPRVDKERLDMILEAANVKEFVDRLPDGIYTRVGEYGGKLSGGQRQRIAIARALIRDPQIIVFDEATSALDNISEHHVQEAMKNLIRGRTTFIVAHRLSTIRDADRIVVMKSGECVECGTYEELMNLKGEFYNLNNLQS